MSEKLNSQIKSQALDGLFKEILKETEKSMYTVYHTLDKSRDGYDCLAIQYNVATGEKTKRMFFEVFLSERYDDDLFIEKQKLDLMRGLINEPERDSIYYVNFTPQSTIIFDLTKAQDGLVFTSLNGKEVAYIDIIDGKPFDYVRPSIETEAFPKDEVLSPVNVKQVKPVTELDTKIPDWVKLNENGEVTYESLEEFKSYPYNIQMRYVMENFLRKFLYPTENKIELMAKYGSLEKLYKYVNERSRREFLSKYGFIVEGPNKHELL